MSTGRACMATVVGLAAAASMLGGCASSKDYGELVKTNNELQARNEKLVQTVEELRQENVILSNQRSERESLISQYQARIDRADATISGLEGDFNSLNTQLMNTQLMTLDPATDRALRELASKNPGLVSYDAARGMLRFSSDLTFDSGSDIVKDSAKLSLTKLAEILKSSSATNYEIHVVGHTDSQQISSGTATRHPTNMHLSCHRAIAVRRELVGMGVGADRVMASGWGEFRPLVPNTARGNTPQNRRVDIYFTASSAGNQGTVSAFVPDDQDPPGRRPDPTK